MTLVRTPGGARGAAALGGLLLAAAAACGTAVPHAEVVSAAHGTGGAGGAAPAAAAGPAAGEAAGSAPAAVASAVTAPATGSGAPTGGAGHGGGAASAVAVGPSPGAVVASAAPKTAATAAVGGGAKASTSAAPGGAADTSPIIIGSVGNYSGAPGAVLRPEADSVQVWAKWINAKGGVMGHPVKVIVVDDASDPSRYRSAVQDLVENQHVVAFVGNGAAQTADAGMSYLEQKQVPVVGAGDGNKAWTGSPVYFNLQSPTGALMDGALRQSAATTHPTKVAILACVEAQACTQYYDQMPNYTSRNGMTVVYKTNISVTQVDFTNECLQARSRGADLVVPVGDQNTFHRVFSDCGRQGYHPAFIASAGNDTDANVQGLDNVAAASGGFPFDGPPGSAAVQDYLTAFHTYAPSEPFGIYTSLGWASAKLFQHVAETVLGAGGPLTSGRLLSALWSLKGYSVDGLSLPLTYTQGKASQGTPFCWFPMLFTGGHWTAPSGMQTVCDNP